MHSAASGSSADGSGSGTPEGATRVKPVDRQTLSYQYGAQTPSLSRGPAGQDSIAAENGTSSAAQSARRPASGAASRSVESMTGPPNASNSATCWRSPRSSRAGADRTRAYDASSERGSRIKNACRNGRNAARSTDGS